MYGLAIFWNECIEVQYIIFIVGLYSHRHETDVTQVSIGFTVSQSINQTISTE